MERWGECLESNQDTMSHNHVFYHWITNSIYGRGDTTWTCDTMLPRHVLYQTELHPDIFWWKYLESNQDLTLIRRLLLTFELYFHILVTLVGFEPTTYGLEDHYTIHCVTGPIGSQGWARTNASGSKVRCATTTQPGNILNTQETNRTCLW